MTKPTIFTPFTVLRAFEKQNNEEHVIESPNQGFGVVDWGYSKLKDDILFRRFLEIDGNEKLKACRISCV